MGLSFARQFVYGDTDSIFVEYVGSTLNEAIHHAKSVVAPAIDAQLPSRVKVKFEKILYPFLLQHTRHYAGLAWQEEDVTDAGTGTSAQIAKLDKTRLEVKGMESVRRNTMPFLVDCMESTLLQLFQTPDDLDKVKDVVRRYVNALMRNEPDLFSLTWTKGLWRLGEYDAKVPHLYLMERLEKENPRMRFRVGERVPYVLCQKGSNAPLYQKAEYPAIALAKHMSLDLDEYLKQMRMPMIRLLSLVMPVSEAEELFKPKFKQLQTGKTASAGGIGKFFSRSTRQCVGCRALLNGSPASSSAASTSLPLCESCQTSPWRCLVPLRETKKAADLGYQKTYGHCSHCQRGSMQLEVICMNETCPIMYRREKDKHIMEETQKKLDEIESILSQL